MNIRYCLYEIRQKISRTGHRFQGGWVAFKQLKAVFGIDRKTHNAWVKLLRETGSVIPEQVFRSRQRKIDKEALRKAVGKKPDAHLSELAALFRCSIPAVFYALKKMGITLKKRRLPMQKNPKKNGPNS
ncbi:MAG: IS630 transposase-related protein [Thermoguttaceae bacterium]|nr:IS630 transposase-related protein [Thermoguttaceae bacterium]